MRQEFSRRWDSGPTVELATAGQQARSVAMLAALAVKEQGKAHAQIVMMLAAAGVLVLFMSKTL